MMLLATSCGQSNADVVEEVEYFIDHVLRNISHGRFERSLSGLTAFAAVVTTAEIFAEDYRASFGNK